jgi:hypothetical protein
MVTKLMEWVSITALLMVVTWRPFAGYQVPLDLVVCAGAVMGVLIAKIKPIAEGPFLPESLRFQSEPWTAFYMSGEIIRELRKASENKKFNIPTTKNDMRKAA